MRVKVDVVRCCGAGNCALIAPQVFAQDENQGTVILLREDPPPEQHDLIEEAVLVCPTRAISVSR